MAADLDLTMPVEKTTLVRLNHVEGCRTDEERRAFADALARKRQRAPFPDEFNRSAIREIQRRIKDKHNRSSDEGHFLRNIAEIRVRAAPSWRDHRVALSFFFILEEGAITASGMACPTPEDLSLVETLMNRFQPTTRFVLDPDMPWRLCRLADMTAEEYVHSDRLDLDDLSTG